MSDRPLTVRVDAAGEDGVAIITLDLAGKRNAMTPELTEDFGAAVARVRRDGSARAVLLCANGPAFCAGGDLDSLTAQLEWTPERNRSHMARFYRVYLGILHVDVPVVAAINGPAVGAGLMLAVACDLRIAADDARLGATFLELGLAPGMGSTHLLPQLVGEAHAADLLLTARPVDARESLRLGLVDRVVPVAALRETARAAAAEIATRPTGAVRLAKRALVRRRLDGLDGALEEEAAAQASSFASAEMRAAIARIRARTRPLGNAEGAGRVERSESIRR